MHVLGSKCSTSRAPPAGDAGPIATLLIRLGLRLRARGTLSGSRRSGRFPLYAREDPLGPCQICSYRTVATQRAMRADRVPSGPARVDQPGPDGARIKHERTRRLMAAGWRYTVPRLGIVSGLISMQRELELKIELGPSNIARLEGELSAADLVIRPAEHKNCAASISIPRSTICTLPASP